MFLILSEKVKCFRHLTLPSPHRPSKSSIWETQKKELRKTNSNLHSDLDRSSSADSGTIKNKQR